MIDRADKVRTFVGSMTCEMVHGKEILRGKVNVKESMLISTPVDSAEALYRAMDSICILKLDYGLHERDFNSE